jgi:diphosphomevalonate decarboxylase
MKSITSRAPINIALIKYWGKRDQVDVLPFQPSLSLSLDIFETRTTITQTKNKTFTFLINGKEDSIVKHKTEKFIKLFDSTISLSGIRIETNNSGPTAAGLASSASGFAALSVAVNHFFGFTYDINKLAEITRKGSGSAIRSLLPKAVAWYPDGHIEKVDFPFDDVVLGVVIINDQQKSIGSTEAMQLSVETSPNYQEWVDQSFVDFNEFQLALKQKNFIKIGQISEDNALRMHRVCETTIPSIQYLSKRSYEVIHLIQALRNNMSIPAFVTMDAGPNVKVLTKVTYKNAIEKALSDYGIDILWSGIDTKGAVIIDG